MYFKDYYDNRRRKGKFVGKKKCIYLDPEVPLRSIKANIITNPVEAFGQSGFLVYNCENRIFWLIPELWTK